MNATVIKSAFHGISTAVMQNAPAIAAGLAIAAGAVALYKAAKCGCDAKREIDKAKDAKRAEMIEKLQETMKKATETLEAQAEIEEEIEKVQKMDIKLNRKEMVDILVRTMWRPAVWGFTAAICVIASVVLSQKQIKAATAIAAGASAAMSDRIAAETAIIGGKKVKDVDENMYTKRAEEALRNITDEPTQIIRTGKGDQLFVEPMFTQAVFYSSVPAIRDGIINLNERLRDGERLSVNDYLDELGLPLPKNYYRSGFLYEPGMPSMSDKLLVDFYGSKELITLPSGVITSAIAVVLCNDPHEGFEDM